MSAVIKILNPDNAKKLINVGFLYILEAMNGKTIYSFFVTEELMDFVNKNFTKKDYLLSNKITFEERR